MSRLQTRPRAMPPGTFVTKAMMADHDATMAEVDAELRCLDASPCGACGSEELQHIGTLGRAEYFRCRCCGNQWGQT